MDNKEPTEKLLCELAYSNFLFWLLLIQKSHPLAVYCANQGLWALLTATISCWLVQIIGGIKAALTGTILNIPFSIVYGVLFIIFLIFMLFLASSCFRNVMAIHRGEQPSEILFFDRKAILK